jgi:2-C-methyl-D-erythritol 2,4-cyclodiphosphate synthase
MKAKIKIGLGKDSHLFMTSGNKELILGGVVMPEQRGLEANSDGDVVYHALANALLSALGNKSLGYYFPKESSHYDSNEYILFCKECLQQKNCSVMNISIVIEAKKPKIDEISSIIVKNISKLLDLNPAQIGITATSGENITPWGQGLGIEVTVTVLIIQVN